MSDRSREGPADGKRRRIRIAGKTARREREETPPARGSGDHTDTRVPGKRGPGSTRIRVPRRGRRLSPKLARHTPSAFMSERYKLDEPIGAGGMGLVYRARDTVLGMPVAIKFLPKHLLFDRGAVSRFKREAATAMRLAHPHIVRLFGLQEEGGRMFLVMEYVDGCDFRRLLAQGSGIAVDAVVGISASCTQALQYAHTQGVLHKDLKPENLMVTQDQVVKIVDFGTALRLAEGVTGEEAHTIEGTPAYMSPEQLQGLPLDARTDVYTLGLVLYELLAARPVFPLDAEASAILRTPRPALDNIPPEIAEVLDRATAWDREQRWPTAASFHDAFATAAARYCG